MSDNICIFKGKQLMYFDEVKTSTTKVESCVTKIKDGKYVSVNNDGTFMDWYRIILDIKDCEKTYIFKLVEFQSRYGAVQMESLFRDKKKCIIRKDKPCGHALRIWDDKSFTFYPYQAGVPYYFTLIEGE